MGKKYDKSIKFWLCRRDDYIFLKTLAIKRQTTMSKILRIAVGAIAEVLRSEYMQAKTNKSYTDANSEKGFNWNNRGDLRKELRQIKKNETFEDIKDIITKKFSESEPVPEPNKKIVDANDLF